jgi:hypothetical protein
MEQAFVPMGVLPSATRGGLTKKGRKPGVVAAIDQLKAAHRRLLVDLMERIWGIGPELTVRPEDLRDHGFDPDPELPDLDLYW